MNGIDTLEPENSTFEQHGASPVISRFVREWSEIKRKGYKILRALGVKIPLFVLSKSPVVE